MILFQKKGASIKLNSLLHYSRIIVKIVTHHTKFAVKIATWLIISQKMRGYLEIVNLIPRGKIPTRKLKVSKFTIR